MQFEHDEERHLYWLDGQLLPSTTDVLADQGFSDYDDVPMEQRRFALQIGIDVHKATQLLDQRAVGWTHLYRHVEGEIEAYIHFKQEYEFLPLVIEEPGYDPIYRYASRPDRYGLSSIGKITLQIKTGRVPKWVALQTAAEERILIVSGHIHANDQPVGLHSTDRRMAVELCPDATYKPTRFNDESRYGDFTQHLRVFLNALTVHRWKKMYGGKRAR